MEATNESLFITPMPAVPRAGDLIDAEHMINPDELPPKVLEEIFRLSWIVDFVSWKIDSKGYYAELWLKGE